jgi:membrane protease YdiL (CAAX protease family)
VFAGLHATNPNASTWSVIALLLAGVLLAAGFVLTGELAIPIGIHITWNFFQGVVWGFPVSGVDTGVAIVAIERTGPGLFTGGAFGPEGGLLGTAAKLLGIATILAWVYYRRGELAIVPEITEPELRDRPTDSESDE